MTPPPDPATASAGQHPNYQYGYWYEINGYDWYFTQPARLGDGAVGPIGNEDLDEDELPPHLRHAEEIHYIILDIQYGLLNEIPQEAGVTSAFAYLLQSYLENRALARTGKLASASHPIEQPESVAKSDEDSAQENKAQTPSISVVAGKSFLEISARAAAPEELVPIWEDLASVLADPKNLYYFDAPHIAANSINVIREASLLTDALRYRQRHYAGALWHNDVTLRTGMSGAALAPLDTTHSPRRIMPAIDVLVHRLNPAQGKVRHAFRTTHPTLMGAAFTTPPQPWTIEEILADSEERPMAFEHGGTLETDDADALLSVSFPLSLSNMMTAVLLAQIIAQITYETVEERAVLRADRYVYGENFVVTFAMGGDWSVEDGRRIIANLMRVPHEGSEVIPEDTLQRFIEEFRLDGHYESVLYTRRAERENISTELIRARLYEAFTRFHLPEPLVTGELQDKYPLLTPAVGLRVAYGSGQGIAFPLPLEENDLERDFLEPEGEQFLSRCRLGSGTYPYLAPHRLSLSDECIVGEWFVEEEPSSALVRRLAVRWADLRAWYAIGEATALMDAAGRVLFVLPTLYDRVGPLYSTLEKYHDRVKSQVINATGGEADLRYRVREMVAYMAQQQAQHDIAHSVKYGVTGHNQETPIASDSEGETVLGETMDSPSPLRQVNNAAPKTLGDNSAEDPSSRIANARADSDRALLRVAFFALIGAVVAVARLFF